VVFFFSFSFLLSKKDGGDDGDVLVVVVVVGDAEVVGRHEVRKFRATLKTDGMEKGLGMRGGGFEGGKETLGREKMPRAFGGFAVFVERLSLLSRVSMGNIRAGGALAAAVTI